MTSFYVNHKSDAQLLDQIKRRVCVNDRAPDVFIGKFMDCRYNGIEKDRASTEYPTLMDLLIIDNNCVFNCLIDQVRKLYLYFSCDGLRPCCRSLFLCACSEQSVG